MPKINTCNRGPHEAKTIKRLYQKMVGNLRAQVISKARFPEAAYTGFPNFTYVYFRISRQDLFL